MSKFLLVLCGATFGWVVSSAALFAGGSFNMGNVVTGLVILCGWIAFFATKLFRGPK